MPRGDNLDVQSVLPLFLSDSLARHSHLASPFSKKGDGKMAVLLFLPIARTMQRWTSKHMLPECLSGIDQIALLEKLQTWTWHFELTQTSCCLLLPVYLMVIKGKVLAL